MSRWLTNSDVDAKDRGGLNMPFVFQQPGSASLLDALNDAARGADSGGGLFAFALRGGIERLLDAPRISKMLSSRKPFRLVVGMDAITNAEALLYLQDRILRHNPAFEATAFLHENPGTFHPKFSWFTRGDKLLLVTGSGNLTVSGLGSLSSRNPPPGNWEAFTVLSPKAAESREILKSINSWLSMQTKAGVLRSLDDPEVQDRAMANGRVRYSPARADTNRTRKRGVVPAPIQPGAAVDVQDVLLREMPKTRLGQADIGKSALQFFGYKGTPEDVLIQYVSLKNKLEPAVKRRIFENASQNYRLEIKQIADLGYQIAANDDRMILVASKLDSRSFRCTVVPVDASDYADLVSILGPKPKSSGSRQMRQKLMSASDLRKKWPTGPSELLPVSLPIPEP
jgi:hypothetical protein